MAANPSTCFLGINAATGGRNAAPVCTCGVGFGGGSAGSNTSCRPAQCDRLDLGTLHSEASAVASEECVDQVNVGARCEVRCAVGTTGSVTYVCGSGGGWRAEQVLQVRICLPNVRFIRNLESTPIDPPRGAGFTERRRLLLRLCQQLQLWAG